MIKMFDKLEEAMNSGEGIGCNCFYVLWYAHNLNGYNILI